MHTIDSGALRTESSKDKQLLVDQDNRVIVHCLRNIARRFSSLPDILSQIEYPGVSVGYIASDTTYEHHLVTNDHALVMRDFSWKFRTLVLDLFPMRRESGVLSRSK